MRPALKPGLRTIWRNRDTVQIGVDPRRAIALTGMGSARGLLCLLDGSRDLGQVLAAARDLGIDPAHADQVIGLLAAGGALHDAPAAAYRDLPPGLLARLAPELATAGVAHGDTDGGARTLARRQAAFVRVHGPGRIGLCVASLLTAAGVGLVVSTGLRTGQAPGLDMPAGPELTAGAQAGAAPELPGRWRQALPGGRRPDLVVVADSHRRDLPQALVRANIPHLAAHASEAIGVVGPLVEPGRSACLRCLDLTRADGDPAWPLILAHLARDTAGPPACDTVLAATVASQAAAQTLAFIDRGAEAAAVTNGTLELVLPDWQWRRRTWRPHHRCGCGTYGPR